MQGRPLRRTPLQDNNRFGDYQLTLRANWNWRASYEAVGWPAVQVEPARGSQSWLTAAMLVRLKRLKASAMTSILKRSPRGMRRERRISHWKKLGDVKRLRPRFPLQPAGGETRGTWNVVPSLLRQTLAGPKVTPGMKDEVVPPPTEGRACDAPKSRRVSVPVMTLKGRPEENSTMGERVKSAARCLKKPSPNLAAADSKTALFTQRWRWSFTELERSRLGKRLSCGSRGDCKSVESSMAWE